MKILILVLALMCSGCAAGAATAGVAIHANTASNLSSPARQSIIEEVKEWVKDNFQEKGE